MTLSTIEKILFLKSVPLFERIPSEELAGVAQIVQTAQFERGERFIRQGDEGDCLYVIVDGEVDVVIDGIGQVGHIGHKNIIGETAILSGNPRNANCIAATSLTVLKLARDDFWELMDERPEIATGIIRVLVDQLAVLIEKLQDAQPESGNDTKDEAELDEG
jgi:CRP-like cAMP-binding protein